MSLEKPPEELTAEISRAREKREKKKLLSQKEAALLRMEEEFSEKQPESEPAPESEPEGREQSPASQRAEREEGREREERAEEAEASENTSSVLSSENRHFFEGMSKGGRRIANKVYEGLSKISPAHRIVGKMRIAYDQFWINRHQKKALRLKEEMDGLNLRIGSFDETRKRIESHIEYFKSHHVRGAESLKARLQDIDRKKMKLINEKDRVQSRLEKRENKFKLYTNARDLVADNLIRRYEEKLRPLEVELKSLQDFKARLNLNIAVAEARSKTQLAKLGEDLFQMREMLNEAGMKEKEIRKFGAVKDIKKMMSDVQKETKKELKDLKREMAKIEKRIAKVDKKANPYRDKREEFIRIKENRPIKIETVERQRGAEFKGKEEVEAHPREAAGERRSEEKGEAAEGERGGSIGRRDLRRANREAREAENREQRLEVGDYLRSWNKFLRRKYGRSAEVVRMQDFLDTTHLLRDERLGSGDFKNILGQYLKYKKLPTGQFETDIDKFFEQKLKPKS